MLLSLFELLQSIHQYNLMRPIEKKVADIVRQTLKDILRIQMTYTLQHLQHLLHLVCDGNRKLIMFQSL